MSVIVVTIAAILIVGVASMQIANAENGTYVQNVDELSTDTSEREAFAQIEAFTQQALVSEEIPISDILDRLGDTWIEKYDDRDDFELRNTGTREFIVSNLDGTGWADDYAKNVLRIYNFDTMVGTIGDGYEITLLVSRLQMLQDRYEASEPVKKFHAWIATKYPTPESEQEITDRLIDILGDKKFQKLSENYAQSFNDLADSGNVPLELVNADPQYWHLTSQIHICEFIVECNREVYLKYRDGDKKVIDVQKDTTGINIMEYLIPYAYASINPRYMPYSIFVEVSSTACDYHTCSAKNTMNFSPYTGGVVKAQVYKGSGNGVAHAGNAIVTIKGMVCITEEMASYMGARGAIFVHRYTGDSNPHTYGQPTTNSGILKNTNCVTVGLGYTIPPSRHDPFGGKAETLFPGPYITR
ncbi:MAG: hypothetical protein MPI95_02130 [Nitrosopumilus sp.]|nr:hypothetical protein [Nitrosopumilus sp.]MDA7941196.1 hypothetical protein [Nitrosopumilus sp.]MDA7942406.1 hypothetical protein [Nitrosopumilus sp.]MDA7944873.1 hypothetical protein [Nitrosopumilus sp.]MDA7953681.1 hypothetical protein [Nitrosopumilus sp.]